MREEKKRSYNSHINNKEKEKTHHLGDKKGVASQHIS
jgi:hypothetical protein